MESGIVVGDHADPEVWLGPLMGASAQMREVFRLIRTAAPTDITVLIEGESGSGKELAAQVIHA
ncbi:MAG: sigma 54-interacting transcriptional regulator, partial [Rhodocyclaceae bacterium]|nr:sigma 54-interacting transcriptional regulator [Rhodocyclaceae bacterium]